MTTINDIRITEEWIDQAERAGACAQALKWLREDPRTIGDLRERDPDWLIWAIRTHPAAGSLLAAFANDEDEWVRTEVAHHPEAGPLLARLARDSSDWVRAAVACHPEVGALLSILAGDPSVGVRAAVTYVRKC